MVYEKKMLKLLQVICLMLGIFFVPNSCGFASDSHRPHQPHRMSFSDFDPGAAKNTAGYPSKPSHMSFSDFGPQDPLDTDDGFETDDDASMTNTPMVKKPSKLGHLNQKMKTKLQSTIAKTGKQCFQLKNQVLSSLGGIALKMGKQTAALTADSILVAVGEVLAAAATGGATAGIAVATSAGSFAKSTVQATTNVAKKIATEIPKLCHALEMIKQQNCCQSSSKAKEKVCGFLVSGSDRLCRLGGCLNKAISATINPSPEKYRALEAAHCCTLIQTIKAPAKFKKTMNGFCQAVKQGFQEAEAHFDQYGHTQTGLSPQGDDLMVTSSTDTWVCQKQ